MRLIVEGGGKLEGEVRAPPSKSHTHRAMILASLAPGRSTIRRPLICDDTLATAEACQAMGASIELGEGMGIIGVAGRPAPATAQVNVRGSGTTLRLMSAVFALCEGATVLTGDDSVRSRPMGPLLDALADLGAGRAKSLEGEGKPPVCVGGPLPGGSAALEGQSSQFLSGLLIACPLAENDSEISVSNLNSRPYAVMTLEHIGRCGARVYERNLEHFFVPGGQRYSATDFETPGDWSSAANIIAAGALTGSDINVTGLDPNDVQGDKMLPEYFEGVLSGRMAELDLRDHPDLLPILAVLCCRAPHPMKLLNIPHARTKESDRISAISGELGRMGASITQRPDGLEISPSKLRGAEVGGHGDHRIVMALAVAGLCAEGRTIINGADAISKSYPGFADDLAALGAKLRMVN